MHITFVKKILANGKPCAKCADVENRLRRSGHLARIDQVVVADERDPDSEGMRPAPFFVIESRHGQEDIKTTIYTVYLKFARTVFRTRANSVDEAREVMRANPDLGLI